MGSRVIRRVIALLLIAGLSLSTTSAFAASKSPTPKPTVKATVKATVKPTASPTSKPSSKPSATATATKKPTPKASPTKKTVVKKKKKAKVRVTPSPPPSWPPKGFEVEGEVYAKVPTRDELVSIISASKYLKIRIESCTTYICGRVQVASEIGCLWWEAIAVVVDSSGRKLGDLTAAFSGSEIKEFKTLLLISPESAENGGNAKVASVLCHHADRDKSEPTVTYKKVSD
jgi:hypothetical protein